MIKSTYHQLDNIQFCLLPGSQKSVVRGEAKGNQTNSKPTWYWGAMIYEDTLGVSEDNDKVGGYIDVSVMTRFPLTLR